MGKTRRFIKCKERTVLPEEYQSIDALPSLLCPVKYCYDNCEELFLQDRDCPHASEQSVYPMQTVQFLGDSEFRKRLLLDSVPTNILDETLRIQHLQASLLKAVQALEKYEEAFKELLKMNMPFTLPRESFEWCDSTEVAKLETKKLKERRKRIRDSRKQSESNYIDELYEFREKEKPSSKRPARITSTIKRPVRPIQLYDIPDSENTKMEVQTLPKENQHGKTIISNLPPELRKLRDANRRRSSALEAERYERKKCKQQISFDLLRTED